MDRSFLEDLAAQSNLDAAQVLRVAKELAKLAEAAGPEHGGYGLTAPLGRSIDTQSAGLVDPRRRTEARADSRSADS
jgi:hypothetical protein